VFGWERPTWFSLDGKEETHSFRRSNAFHAVALECKAVRENVGLMDLSTFSKFDVTGKNAEIFLNRICANRMSKTDGGVVLAHLLNQNGKILGEVTVTRFNKDHFYVLSGATAQVHDFDLMAHGVLEDENVKITDITDDFGTLVLSGPKSREVLAQVTDTDLSNTAFPWLRGREMRVAGVVVRALRVSYVGELGWELHVPMKQMPDVFTALMDAGKDHGIALFGTYAMNSLRMEKAFRGMGSEMTFEVNLIEADMQRFIGKDKADYVGKDATDAARNNGTDIKLVYMSLDKGDADCLGNEPIYNNGELVGVTTSGAYGHYVGQSLAFGYVPTRLATSGTNLTIEIMGKQRPATIEPDPLWDPKSERMRG